MEERRPVDTRGAIALIGFAALLAFNQVVVKVTGGGFEPVFQAALRSVGASLVVLAWILTFGVPLRIGRRVLPWGILAGVIFAVEFLCLFTALDTITVARSSVIFYSMPVWMALASHFLLPGERLTRIRSLGLVLAMAGVAAALFTRPEGGAHLGGDLLALCAALSWAAIALLVRITPFGTAPPEVQLLCQVVVSAVVLLGLSPLFGTLLRDPGLIHYAGLTFQFVCVVGLGFLAWFKLLAVYRSSDVASFSFLSPVLAVLLGWLLLDEQIQPQVWGALVLVAAGITLINRR